ncbi:AraC family transcriptional regulator [Cohnella herbarum]|uniref:AraC family transcriptional regulator n=1 Tax=Cohnella herbarum TaxID=2728023 RepID=A0A7Z2ZQ53_9BACL|nr:AraC family transcriptional regulator [Cohnella herbarum]
MCSPFSDCLDYLEGIYRNRTALDEMKVLERHIRFQQLLLFLLQQNLTPNKEWNVRQSVEQTIEQMKRYYHDPWTVERLSELANVPRWQYTRLFKGMTGKIPLQYLNEVRIDRAKQLLLVTNDPMFDIAQNVGFGDEYYFNRRFKQAVGVSPGIYRRNNRENIQVWAPFLEDYLVALGVTPAMQCSHANWGKQEYLGLNEVPTFDIETEDVEALSGVKPDFIMMEESFERWIPFDRLNRLAPTFKVTHSGEDWRTTLRTVADLLGKMDKVKEIIGEYEHKANEAKKILKSSIQGQTVACLRVSDAGVYLYSGADHGYTGPVLYKDLGLTPPELVTQLTSQDRRVPLTPEQLVRLDADHVVITFDRLSERGSRSAIDVIHWQMLPAVRNQRVYEVDFLAWMNYGVLSHNRKIDDLLKIFA